MKNGAPMSAVTIPTGNSAGANNTRAIMSAQVSSKAPNNAEIGNSVR